MFCDNLEGWDGVEDGREVPEGGDICIPLTDSCWCLSGTSQYCKANIFQPIKKVLKKWFQVTEHHVNSTFPSGILKTSFQGRDHSFCKMGRRNFVSCKQHLFCRSGSVTIFIITLNNMRTYGAMGGVGQPLPNCPDLQSGWPLLLDLLCFSPCTSPLPCTAMLYLSNHIHMWGLGAHTLALPQHTRTMPITHGTVRHFWW